MDKGIYMRKEHGYILYSTSNTDRVDLTDRDKERVTKMEAHYCQVSLLCSQQSRAQNLHCRSSVHCKSTNPAGFLCTLSVRRPCTLCFGSS